MLNSQTLPNGYILKLREHCGLGAKGQFLSTHKTLNDAEKKAKSMNHSLAVFMVEDIYSGRTYTTK
ncbi:hypothetical protein Nit79A3_0253 [Nitrosomonas sp. Is79A3]|uniref:hypothetical protein n=1 Tax=Nitrosomonas sp. (strain Is79A3) TaxID=261292 RepID=UPI000215D186